MLLFGIRFKQGLTYKMPFNGKGRALPSPYPFQYEYRTQDARMLLSAGFGAGQLKGL